MSYRRKVIEGIIWVEDRCREECEEKIVEQRATIEAQKQEIARQHELLTKALPLAVVTDAPPAAKGGAS